MLLYHTLKVVYSIKLRIVSSDRVKDKNFTNDRSPLNSLVRNFVPNKEIRRVDFFSLTDFNTTQFSYVYLKRIKIKANEICPECKLEEDSIHHILFDCSKNIAFKKLLLEMHIDEPSNLHKIFDKKEYIERFEMAAEEVVKKKRLDIR